MASALANYKKCDGITRPICCQVVGSNFRPISKSLKRKKWKQLKQKNLWVGLMTNVPLQLLKYSAISSNNYLLLLP